MMTQKHDPNFGQHQNPVPLFDDDPLYHFEKWEIVTGAKEDVDMKKSTFHSHTR